VQRGHHDALPTADISRRPLFAQVPDQPRAAARLRGGLSQMADAEDAISSEPEPDEVDPLVFTPAQAAARLGLVTEAWLRRKARERRIPYTRLGGFVGFSQKDLDEIVVQFGLPVPARRPRRSSGPRS
jgi:hypothetical protein